MISALRLQARFDLPALFTDVVQRDVDVLLATDLDVAEVDAFEIVRQLDVRQRDVDELVVELPRFLGEIDLDRVFDAERNRELLPEDLDVEIGDEVNRADVLHVPFGVHEVLGPCAIGPFLLRAGVGPEDVGHRPAGDAALGRDDDSIRPVGDAELALHVELDAAADAGNRDDDLGDGHLEERELGRIARSGDAGLPRPRVEELLPLDVEIDVGQIGNVAFPAHVLPEDLDVDLRLGADLEAVIEIEHAALLRAGHHDLDRLGPRGLQRPEHPHVGLRRQLHVEAHLHRRAVGHPAGVPVERDGQLDRLLEQQRPALFALERIVGLGARLGEVRVGRAAVGDRVAGVARLAAAGRVGKARCVGPHRTAARLGKRRGVGGRDVGPGLGKRPAFREAARVDSSVG